MAKKKSKSHNELIDAVADNRVIHTQALDHSETLRATALAQACQYYINTIVKDGDLYREMVRDNRVLKPATYMGVIEVAISFEAFISGELTKSVDAVLEQAAPVIEAKKELEKEAETPIETQS